MELFTFKAADGKTELHGMLHKPSNFDPTKKYPVLVTRLRRPGDQRRARDVHDAAAADRVRLPRAVRSIRAAPAGRGKRFLDAIYQKLGTVEIDDQAAGVKALWDRPYVDRNRVGIYGTSYGGYASALALLRHPGRVPGRVRVVAGDRLAPLRLDLHRALHVDPAGEQGGLRRGLAMTYADNLKGRLMLYYGTADNNVHPSNTMQLIQALQRAGKSFEVQVGPDAGTPAINTERMMEFFIENLVMRNPGTATAF